LPRVKSWHKDLALWGDEEHNDIQVWRESGNIDSIKIRLDLRGNIEQLKIRILNLTRSLDCYFLIPDKREIIKNDTGSLNHAILDSIAIKFIENPEGFMDEN